MDEHMILCPYCRAELKEGAGSCPHCRRSFAGRNPTGALPVGTLLAGRYTVGEMLSIDGEGILYRGMENRGRFRVTIKEYLPITLSAERGTDYQLRPKPGSEVLLKTTRMDFGDLYRSIQRITPATGLEAVLDVVEANNTVYAVLENPGGVPLDQWLDKRRKLVTPEEACAMLQPVFNGVAAMHQVGLVHRGICPENIRVLENGRARLTGYATIGLRTAGSGLHGQLYEGYSAPEQYSAVEFEGRYTDVYSLSAVFYRMVCGQSPVPAAQRMVTDSNPSAHTVNPAVPVYVSDALDLGLRLDPASRIQTVPQLARALASPEAAEEEARTLHAAGRRRAREDLKGKRPTLSLTAILTGILILLAVLTLLTLWNLLGQTQPSAEPAPSSSEADSAPQRRDRPLCARLCGDELRPDPEQPPVYRHLPVLRHRGLQRQRPRRHRPDPGAGRRRRHHRRGQPHHPAGHQQGPRDGRDAQHHRLYPGGGPSGSWRAGALCPAASWW